ncbi:MAG: response regulator transcription factor [Prochloraceae cyanobacterium]|nr:response regulator transcription factor [Prochloraceae cyanobacterium]
MKKILLVDDDKILRTVLKRSLEKQGYQVEDVASGAEGLTTFTTYSPDLVVSDVSMPEMNGFEFCRKLRSQPSGQLVPFIFLSGKDRVEDRVEGHSIGADDYLTKPFEMPELLAKIEALLEKSRRIHSEIVRLMQQLAVSSASNVLGDRVSNSSTGSQNSNQTTTQVQQPSPLPLTPAEERVFWEVIQGLTNKQISDNLFISPRTVQTHLSNILSKLQLENRAQLVRFAYEQGYQQTNKN